ncbi:MAG: bifunctional glutamate N-acetyltransferase/amino-acid acetyltransferase ArgJ [Armatimonadota bacterium]
MDFLLEQGVLAAKGFRAGTAACGIKRSGNTDVVIISADQPLTGIAMVGTQNVVCAPSVTRNRSEVSGPNAASIRGVVINSGCANVATGQQGIDANSEMAEQAALLCGGGVLTASTGVIGVQLPMDKLRNGIVDAWSSSGTSREHDRAAAEGILTTDIVRKNIAVKVSTEIGDYIIGGISKGSGMIAPNMATMLAFITTDADISYELLQPLLKDVVDRTFNAITVDGDTSTSDQCIVLASGLSGVCISDTASRLYRQFSDALEAVMLVLAKAIARDGEGATKLVEIRVTGAPTDAGARAVAKTIAESPLVKTALFGNDPNWGRLMAAAGRAGVPFDPGAASASIAGIEVYRAGVPTGFNAAEVSDEMKLPDVLIEVDLCDPAAGAFTFYTCDFSYDYVRINAEYTT